MTDGSEDMDDKITVQSSEYPSLEALEHEYTNALNRIEHQHDVLNEFSREGMRMFRILILFVAVPATIIGAFSFDTFLNFSEFLLSSEISISSPIGDGFTVQDVLVASGVFAALSVGFHISATGQDFKGVRSQTNTNEISVLLEHDISKESYLRMKLELLSDKIEENRKTLGVIEDFLAIGKVCTLGTVVGVSILLYNVATGNPFSVFYLLGLSLVAGVGLTRLPRNYVRVDSLFGDKEPYDNDEIEVQNI